MSRTFGRQGLFTIERPQRPQPVELIVSFEVRRDEVAFVWRHQDPEALAKHVKESLTDLLAKQLMERCAPFIRGQTIDGNRIYSIEVTLSDRGSYEHWLPREREQGHTEGYRRGSQAVASRIPYGVEPDQFHE